jgi:hypothetical protein
LRPFSTGADISFATARHRNGHCGVSRMTNVMYNHNGGETSFGDRAISSFSSDYGLGGNEFDRLKTTRSGHNFRYG